MEIGFIAIAFALGYLFVIVGLPPLLGYLAGGFALSALGMSTSHGLDELAHVGVLFLLFTLGLKIRLKNFLQPEVAVSGLLQIVISVIVLVGLFAIIGINQGFSTFQTVLLGVLLGVASTVVAAKGLEEKSELDSYHGRLAIGILVMEDIILIGILAFAGLKALSVWALSLLALPFLRPVFLRVIRTLKSDELVLLYGILMAMGGAMLFEYFGLGGELGAFCFGLLHAGEPKAEELSEKLWSLREAFLIGFFLKIGLTGTPGWQDIGYALPILLILPLRMSLFFGILTRFGLRARTSFLTASSLASFSEFALITGAVATSAGLLPGSLMVTLATIVALSFLVGAPLNAKANGLYHAMSDYLARFERVKSRSDAEPSSIGMANYLVVGMGRTGTSSYDFLAKQGEKVVGFDTDPGVLALQRAQKRRVVYGDANSHNLWENLDLKSLRGIILTIGEETAKIYAVGMLRQRGFAGNISAIVESDEQRQRLLEAGVTILCSPPIQAGIELAEQAQSGVFTTAVPVKK